MEFITIKCTCGFQNVANSQEVADENVKRHSKPGHETVVTKTTVEPLTIEAIKELLIADHIR